MPFDPTQYNRPKSSRRKRWEVKSKELFETSLAVEVDSPDKSQPNVDVNRNENRPNSRRPKSSVKKVKKFEYDNTECATPTGNNQENSDMTAKLSALLDDASDISYEGSSIQNKLRDSEENLIKSELNDYFKSYPPNVEPSAPPFSPPKTPKKVTKTPKKKVSLKVKPIHSGVNIINSKITQQLQQLSEDVISEKEAKKTEPTTIPAVAVSGLLLGPSSSSTFNGNVSTIYCEKLNNFVISRADQMISPKKNKPVKGSTNAETKNQYAYFIQNGFRTFSVFCQGALAGLTFAHCLMIFLLEESVSLLLEKKSMEHTFYALIFFLSSICLVAAFDRCDLAGQGVFSEHGIRIPWTPLFYLVSMVLTLIMMRAEDFIIYFSIYPENIQSEKEEFFSWWKYMCLVRTFFTVVAWMGLVADPHTDALSSRISKFSGE